MILTCGFLQSRWWCYSGGVRGEGPHPAGEGGRAAAHAGNADQNAGPNAAGAKSIQLKASTFLDCLLVACLFALLSKAVPDDVTISAVSL